MGAETALPPVVQHKDAVRVFDGGRPLRDHHDRHIFRLRPQRAAQRRIGGVVQSRGGIIQNQDIRLLRQCPRDGQALLLAAGEVFAAFLYGLWRGSGIELSCASTSLTRFALASAFVRITMMFARTMSASSVCVI